MKEQDIIKAYTKIRTIDNTIPDDVLDFMKNAAIEQLRLCGVVGSATECRHNSQQEKLNYLKWYEFAESEVAKGNKQIKCSKCNKWLFPSEL